MGSILKTILPIAGTFLGGPAGGALGGVLGGLIGGNQSQGQATNAYGTAQGQAQLPGQLQSQYLPQLYQMMSQMQGSQPFGQMTQQNATTNPLVFGDLATRSMTPAYNAQVSQYGDSAGGAASQATNQLAHSLGGRGFGGATSFMPSEAGAIQRGAQQQVSQQKANIGGQAANAEQGLAQYQQGTQYNQAMNATNTQYQRLLQMATGMMPANIGGQQAGGAYYQGQANNAFGGVQNGLGSLSSLFGGGLFGGGLFGGGGGGTPADNQAMSGGYQPTMSGGSSGGGGYDSYGLPF